MIRSSLLGLSALLLTVASGCSDEDMPPPGGSTGGSGATGTGGTGTGTGGQVGGTGNTGGGATGGAASGGGMSTGGAGVPTEWPDIETVPCQGAFSTEDVSGAEHFINVDGGRSWGNLPHFWHTFGTGHLGLYLREENTNYWGEQWGDLLHAHTEMGVQELGLKRMRSHGLFHDDLGIYSEDGSGQPVYDFSKSDIIFDFYVEQGIVPIIELAPMPSQLAADPSRTVFEWGMIISQPKDYALWQDLVANFAQHSLDRYGLEVVSQWDWEVWNEPECCRNKFWAGTLEEYHQLYDYAAAGVRSVLPEGRVGGPVTSQPLELEDNSMAGIKFLDHVTTDNYVTPGSPGVLDFFAFHSWSFVGGAVDGYFQGLDLLDRYGLTETPIAITEFGPTWEFKLFDEPQEMHQGAAFVAQVFSDISRRVAQEGRRFPMAYSWWVLSDVFEEDLYPREDEPFFGCMGLISREGIKKPAFNAYKFLSQMGNEQLELTMDGPGDVGGMAARTPDGGVQVIIYHGQDPGAGPGDDTYYAEMPAQTIGVTLQGLPADTSYDVTAYRVDDVTGNAYAQWQEWGRPKMADMTDENWETLRSGMESPAEPMGSAVCGETFSHTFSLSSPGVLFLTLTPAVAQ